jgi:hypothetical protein
VSDIEDRLCVVDALRAHSHARSALQQRLRQLPDSERLLPKAAQAFRRLRPPAPAAPAGPQNSYQQQQQQHGYSQHRTYHGHGSAQAGGLVCGVAAEEDPADSAWALQAQQRAWAAVEELLDGLGRCGAEREGWSGGGELLDGLGRCGGGACPEP